MTTDNFCFYLQNRLIQTSQTGGQWYSDTSPFSIPCLCCYCSFIVQATVITIANYDHKTLSYRHRSFNSREYEFLPRWELVLSQLNRTGTYELTTEELEYGAKLAWRNHTRCIARHRCYKNSFNGRNLQMLLIGKSNCPWQAFPAYLLIGLTRKH